MDVTLTMNEIQSILEVIEEIKNEKIPFALTLILLKDREKLQNEFKFYTSRMQEIMQKYFQTDEKNNYKRNNKGGYFIKEGMEEECIKAINEVSSFDITVDLKMIPSSLMENTNFSLKQIEVLSHLLMEENESN